MMFKTKFILLWSENPDKLVKFYTDILGLELLSKTDIPAKDGLEKDYGYDLKLSEQKYFMDWPPLGSEGEK